MGKELLTIDELSEEIEVAPNTIRNYQRKGMPFTKGKTDKEGNRYDPDAVAAWMVANKLTGDVGRRSGETTDEMKKQQLRKVTAQADKYEQELKTARMEYDIECGRLMAKEDVESGRLLRIHFVKNVLLGLPSALSAKLVGLSSPEIQTALETEIQRILDHFSTQ